jgi:hypothetical protein
MKIELKLHSVTIFTRSPLNHNRKLPVLIPFLYASGTNFLMNRFRNGVVMVQTGQAKG